MINNTSKNKNILVIVTLLVYENNDNKHLLGNYIESLFCGHFFFFFSLCGCAGWLPGWELD